jgi:hypothetical protein
MLESFATNAPDPLHWTLNSYFGPFCTRWVHLGPFYCLSKLISKWAELVQLMQKCVLWSRVGIFHNEHTRSTPFYPKLMLWCISYILDMFRTISLQHETRCRTSQIGAINSKVRDTKACRIFYNDCTRSTPFDPKLILWCILYCLGTFGTFFSFWNSFQNGPNWCN